MVTLAAVSSLAFLAILFRDTLVHFVQTWQSDANYSHGFLVPLITLYFAAEAARRGPIQVKGGLVTGVGLMLLSIFGLLATLAVPVGVVADVAFVLGLTGLVALFAGRDALRRFAFPLAFLVFMIPLPVALYAALASPLQLWVSRAASWLLNAGGIPVFRQGNLMMLPGGVTMFVAEACSGMRQLTGFLALTTAVAWLTPRPWWHRVILIVSSVPIAMTANLIRVIVTGFIMYRLDPRYASGAFHTVEGLLMMGLGLGLLSVVCTVLTAIAPRAAEPAGAIACEAPRPRPSSSRAGARAIVGPSLLGLGLLASAGVAVATATPRPLLREPLASLPLVLGSWVGRDVAVDPLILKESQCDEYVNRLYEDTSSPGRTLSLWINYSRLGANLRHSPEVCLPSGGWEKIEARTAVIEVPVSSGGTPLRLTRLAYQQGELVQGVGFWYYIFGEGALERYVRSLPVTSRSSHGRATRGSSLTVEVFSPGVVEPEPTTLRSFAAEVARALDLILPEDRAGYHRP
jgi:exosortase